MVRSFILLVLFCAATAATAQQYTTAAGIRIAADPGITIQQHFFKKLTLEGMLQKSLLSSRSSAAVLLEQHFPIIRRDLNLYIGAGPQVSSYRKTLFAKPGSERKIVYGLAVAAGIELTVQQMLFSIDFKPVIEAGGPALFYNQAAFSIRYVLIRRSLGRKSPKTGSGLWPFRK